MCVDTVYEIVVTNIETHLQACESLDELLDVIIVRVMGVDTVSLSGKRVRFCLI